MHIPADWCGSLKGGWSAQRQLICVVWASGSQKEALDTPAGKVGGRRGQQFWSVSSLLSSFNETFNDHRRRHYELHRCRPAAGRPVTPAVWTSWRSAAAWATWSHRTGCTSPWQRGCISCFSLSGEEPCLETFAIIEQHSLFPCCWFHEEFQITISWSRAVTCWSCDVSIFFMINDWMFTRKQIFR